MPEPFPIHALSSRHSYGWHVAAPLASILGRDADIDALVRLLESHCVRMVTLTGPGGIGKTRLSREVAVRKQAEFAHGACFVPFAALRDPQLIATVVAQSLGFQMLSEWPADDVVIEALRDRHLLLVLDNLRRTHQARVGAVVAMLGKFIYRKHWAKGHALDVDAVLTKAFAWEPPLTTPSQGTHEAPQELTDGDDHLSSRQLEVLHLMADGLTNQEIANALFVSQRTIASHVASILGKLGLGSRTGAVAHSIRNGIA